MRPLKMSHKLWLAVLVIVVALLAVVGFAGYRTANNQAQGQAQARSMAARVEAAMLWAGLTETNAARTQALVVSADPAVGAEFKEVIAATSAFLPVMSAISSMHSMVIRVESMSNAISL